MSTLFVSRRTHANLIKQYGVHCEGMAIWWVTSKSIKFIGTIVNSVLVKP